MSFSVTYSQVKHLIDLAIDKITSSSLNQIMIDMLDRLDVGLKVELWFL